VLRNSGGKMKTPLKVIIIIVVAIIGFLTYYSLQRDVPEQSAGVDSSAPAADHGAAPAGGEGK
jgi:hypothetical protein